jgi:glycosyltransferase involved in cell wall biosynthesis
VAKRKNRRTPQGPAGAPPEEPGDLYRQACQLAVEGKPEAARSQLEQLEPAVTEVRLKALVRNDLATLRAQAGDPEAARQGFQAALALDPACETARANLALLEEDFPGPAAAPDATGRAASGAGAAGDAGAVRVAVLSFLFNWPSTGGGIVHTVELARFLQRAGFVVHHFYARFPAWGLGKVEEPLGFPSQALEFAEADWDLAHIKDRFRAAVDAFGPDHVLITDSWNVKPHLADAVRGHPYVLRFQAMECLCPLNNVRLLPEEGGRFRQCPRHQLASPEACSACVGQRGHLSGGLHQAERALSGVGAPEYHAGLLRALREAEAVLVVNPLHEAMLSPYSDSVRVVTAGMDPARFPWPDDGPERVSGKRSLLFAGLVDEWMKGFAVLHDACARLWQRRQDFELVATGDPPGPLDAFTRFIGWQSQEALPGQLLAADVLVMPTIAQEALGRTAVEAMAAGRPVIASRLGGLPFTVIDGATGLLCEPGDPADLAAKIQTLLDDDALRQRFGMAGRRRFEEHYSWPVVIDRHYRPLLQRRRPEGCMP